MVPRRHLESVGLEPMGQRVYELVDGSELQMDITAALVEVMGLPVGATIIMADGDAEPLLGVTALESAGIEVDPRNETLKRLPSVRLKGARQA
jgi:clan AA aspartic protease